MKLAPTTRASLVVRLKNPKDSRAWHEFIELYEPLILRLLRSRGLQDADARDVTQEVLLAVARAVHRFDPKSGKGTFRGWLAKIVRNLTVNFLVRLRNQPRGYEKQNFEPLDSLSAPSGGQSDLFELHWRRQLFLVAADAIKNEVRAATWQVFWETWIEDREITQVASELGMSVGAAYVARSRVMARLKDKVANLVALESH